MKVKNIKLSLTLIVIFVLTVAAYTGRHYFYTSKLTTQKTPTLRVYTSKSKIMNIPITHETTGTLLAPNTITINPQIPGTITKVAIQDGQHVKKGQLLFQLDDVKQQADLTAAKATLDSTFDTYSRKQKLFQKSGDIAISKTDINQAKNAYLADKSAVISSKKLLAETKINAPLDGTVSVLPNNINVGSVVDSSTHLVTLVIDTSLQVNYTLGEKDLNLVKLGQSLITWPIGNKKNCYHTTVSYISPAIASASRTFTLRANIIDPKHDLKPGLLMHIKQTLKANHKVIVVPSIAIVPDIAGYCVYTIKDGKAAKRSVIIGQLYKQYIGIKKGLRDGERVITSRLNIVKEGSSIQGVSAP